MKKCILLLTALLTFGVNAQDIDFGVRGGLNFSSLGDVTADGATGLNFGAFARVKFANIAIQPELSFSKEGAKDVGIPSLISAVGGAVKDVKLNYVNVPILVKFYLPSKFSINAGPVFKIRTNSIDDALKAAYGDLKSFNFQLAAGASLELTDNIDVDGRYIFSVSKLNESNGLTDPDISGGVVQISIGYSFL